LFSRHVCTLCRSNLSHPMADYNTWVKITPETVTLRPKLLNRKTPVS